MVILGIETSCDETAAAVIRGVGSKVEVLSNVISSQIEIHKKYGGVVPEVAAREHVLNILPVVNEALAKAGITPLAPLVRGVDLIAVTVGPGLVTSLLVGVETAKTLAYVWRVPVVAVNHIEGHIYANWLKPISKMTNNQIPISERMQNAECKMQNKIKFPVLILTVSGGHTMLVLMSGHGKYKVLGETRDDAAGEAFDKAASLLQLGYPGGPEIAKWALQFKQNLTTHAPLLKGGLRGVNLPRPMINSGDFDFSFSGLKTALLYAIQRDPLRLPVSPRQDRGGRSEASKNWQKKIPEYAHEFQQAVADVLIYKTIKAALKYKVRHVMLCGGVAANLELRRQLEKAVKEKLPDATLSIPEFKYCTDNAAMVAVAGYFRVKRKKFTNWQKLKADANLELTK